MHFDTLDQQRTRPSRGRGRAGVAPLLSPPAYAYLQHIYTCGIIEVESSRPSLDSIRFASMDVYSSANLMLHRQFDLNMVLVDTEAKEGDSSDDPVDIASSPSFSVRRNVAGIRDVVKVAARSGAEATAAMQLDSRSEVEVEVEEDHDGRPGEQDDSDAESNSKPMSVDSDPQRATTRDGSLMTENEAATTFDMESALADRHHTSHPAHPTRPFIFDGLNYHPVRNVATASATAREDRTFTSTLLASTPALSDYDEKVVEKVREQRKMPGDPWLWDFDAVINKAVAKPNLSRVHMTRRCVSFFPYAHIAGLSHMASTFVVCIGPLIELYKVVDNAEDNRDAKDQEKAKIILLCTAKSLLAPRQSGYDAKEKYHSLAWSVDTSHWPFVPILAAGGEGRVIDIYRYSRDCTLSLDRTITLHGQRINHLTFSQSHPHLLASASDDHTVCLWDPIIPWGSNDAVVSRFDRTLASTASARPFVPGELLAKFDVGSHTEGILSCDIHPSLPLIVTSGMDGQIKIVRFPLSIAGPTWPTELPAPAPAPAVRARCLPTYADPPLNYNKAISLGPPIFASGRVHPGTWCDQVLWADVHETTIISKAAAPRIRRRYPRMLVKRWQPSILDVDGTASLSASDDDDEDDDDDGEENDDDDEQPTGFSAVRVENELAFLMLQQIEIQGLCYIGDRIGYHRDSRPGVGDDSDDDEEDESTLESILAIPSLETSLYVFTPNSNRQFLPLTTETADRLHSSKPVQRLQPDYFPLDRPQFEYDFFPRLLPAAVSDLDGKGIHSRCTAISPCARWIVAVGDGGRMTVWKRGRRSKQDRY